ncbi:MAG: AzlC family ABC transporter permease [Spirochaetales bacterium]
MNTSHHLSAAISAGIRAASPVVIAYLGIGFAAGVVKMEAGMSVAEVALLSLFVFAGSAQFVFAELYTGASAALIGTVFLINLRHLLYSTAITPRVRHHSLASRFWIGAQLTDETFALSTSLMGNKLHSAAWLIALNVASYLSWVAGTVAGAVAGSFAGAVENLGLEFALAAMFAALLVLQFSRKDPRSMVKAGVAVLAAALIVTLETVRPNPMNLVGTTLTAATIGLLADRLLVPKAASTGPEPYESNARREQRS